MLHIAYLITNPSSKTFRLLTTTSSPNKPRAGYVSVTSQSAIMPPKGKGDKGGAAKGKGKGKPADEKEEKGAGKVKGAQFVNVRHILVHDLEFMDG